MRDFVYDVFRIMARWVMWSRGHFAVAVLAVLAAVTLLGVATRGDSRPIAEPTVIISATVLESGPAAILTESPRVNTPTSSQTNSLTNSASPTLSVDPAIPSVAASFTGAWANRGQSTATWRNEFAPYATPRLNAEFSKTDVSAVQVNFVSGRPVVIGIADGNVAVRVPCNGGLYVQLVVVHSSGSWLVNQVDSVDAG